jgi:hypothetical protein
MAQGLPVPLFDLRVAAAGSDKTDRLSRDRYKRLFEAVLI